MSAPFGERLQAAMRARGPLCVGIDPHPALLATWGLPDSAAGVAQFGRIVLDAVGTQVAAIKPQSALFERHGSAGVAALEELIDAARGSTLTIVDAKRGDIGSTMSAYADTYVRDGSPLAGDAVTLSPFLGVGSLQPAFDAAAETGRGAFVLALTSNPEGRQIQHALAPDGRSVAGVIADEVRLANAVAFDGFGSFGLVVGATIGTAAADLGVRLDVGGPILSPGVGAQGAGPDEVRTVFGPAHPQVLVAVSRDVLRVGPDQAALAEAVRSRQAAFGQMTADAPAQPSSTR